MFLAIAVILLALFFDFSNGFHDAANFHKDAKMGSGLALRHVP